MNILSLRLGAIAAVVFALSTPLQAAEAVLLDGGNITITTQDIQTDALRIPLEMRETVLSRPDQVRQLASNLYVRRALAQQADAAGLANTPELKAALQQARDKVLSDAMLAKIDKDNDQPDAKLEGVARNNYNAKPENFKAPEQVHVRHILITGHGEAEQAKATKILAELQAGADFATLAKEYSADPGSAANGGDLAPFAKDAMVPEFEAAAFAMQKKGQLSELVKTQFGYHILRFEGRTPAGSIPFAEVRADLIQQARSALQQDARVQAAAKIQQGATLHKEAIEAFAASNKSAP